METTTTLHSVILHTNVKTKLDELIEQAECLQMAVAYWTIPSNYFGNNLIELLKKKDSFACVDISSPTKIEEVCNLADATKNFYFYTKKTIDKNKITKELMHSKVLLFDLPKNQASIWIGSHNWTNQAIVGINIETSLELLVSRSSEIYKQVRYLLDSIRSQCHRVYPDDNHIRVYKRAQKQEKSILYLQSNIELDYREQIKNDKPFIHLILDREKPNITHFPNHKEIIVLMNDSRNHKQFLFVGEIFKSGDLPATVVNSKWQDFEDGYICLRQNDRFSNFIHTSVGLSQTEKDNAYSFVTIKTEKVKMINDINREVYSKYETPISLNQRLTVLELIDNRWLRSEEFPTKENNWNKRSQVDYLREVKREMTDYNRGEFIFNDDTELDWFLKEISLSGEQVLVKEQLIDDYHFKNLMSEIPKGLIEKVIKKKE